jgi:hypothetical protein
MSSKNRYALSLAKDVIHTGVKRIKNLVGMVYTVSTLIPRQPNDVMFHQLLHRMIGRGEAGPE